MNDAEDALKLFAFVLLTLAGTPFVSLWVMTDERR
jgi:hypothetical protein